MKGHIKLLIVVILIIICAPGCSYEFTIAPWENGIIPYYLSGEFTETDLNNLYTAMGQWEGVCGVKFTKVTPRANAYEIIHDTQRGWYSTIGENNSQCYMNFNAVDTEIKSITHELGHCLGLVHEHQRPDRDNYISISWGNIVPGKEFNFEIMDNPLIDEQEFEYDYNSIMHYPPISFSTDGSVTIVTRNGHTISQDGISEIDARKALAIYGPPLEDDDIEEY
jgi:hypothetical protein